VFEWAGSPDGAFLHCRFYRKGGNVRIAVADDGIGIPAALRGPGAPQLRGQSDIAVVEAAATRAGLSASPHSSRGLGLKLIRDLVIRRGGRLTLISHTALVSFGPGDAIRRRLCGFVRGTAVDLDFRPHLSGPAQEAIF
jgi:sensor histidine kinase regulating citrate/malate metabolism